MTSMSTSPEPSEILDRSLDGSYEGPVRITGKLRRLLISLVPANIVIFIIWGGVPSIMLALQVNSYDPIHKVSNLAVITTIGAFAAMIAQPVAGVVSDRTRSRLGRRTPWILIGSAAGGVFLILLGLQNTIAGMAVFWVLVQISYNFAQGPLSAIMPDRVPRQARGTFAAANGIGLMVGMLGGQFVGAAFSQFLPIGYTVFAVVAFAALLVFVRVNPDRPNSDEPREAFLLHDFLATFWVNPVQHPDFAWAFAGRFLLNTGYTLVTGYVLYILADYVGLGVERATTTSPLVSAAGIPTLVLAIAISGPLSDRLGRRKLFVFLAAAVQGLALLIPWMFPTVTALFVFAAIAGVGAGFYQSVDTALITEVLPSEKSFGKDLGVVNIAATLPQTIAPAIAGLIVVNLSYSALFPVAIVLCLLGAVCVWPIRSVR
ncbi:MAG: MFS transporter [Ancrocorticia sp.]|nr:MFS transporter [Ancrocorticia sp.]